MSLRAQQGHLGWSRGRGGRGCIVALLLAMTHSGWLAAAAAAAPQDCVKAEVILWGDGKHDDTAALSAWLRGANATWAITGQPVGARILGHSFRLSSAVYVTAGTGRQLDDFRLLFPERGEVVSGGTINAGDDPDKAPVLSGVTIHGGDSGEGVPFDQPDLHSGGRPNEASCAIS
jgi:hypothetical protein